MEGYLRMFPLQQPYDVPNNFDVWKQDDDIITEVFQAPKDYLVQCYPDDFRSYLRILMSIPLRTWIYSMKNIINHCCAQFLIKVRTLLA
jgi:hypothetical protein